MPKSKFLVDENVLGIDRYLIPLGIELKKVGDPDAPNLGSDDPTVAKYAKDNDFVVITNDDKLVKQCEFLNVPYVTYTLVDLAKKVHEYLEQ